MKSHVSTITKQDFRSDISLSAETYLAMLDVILQETVTPALSIFPSSTTSHDNTTDMDMDPYCRLCLSVAHQTPNCPLLKKKAEFIRLCAWNYARLQKSVSLHESGCDTRAGTVIVLQHL